MSDEDKTLAFNRTTGGLNIGGFVAGTVLANRYRIIGLLGEGGMGKVFKAEDIKLNQTVALKFLPDKLEKDISALERFHAEVRNARQVSHQMYAAFSISAKLRGGILFRWSLSTATICRRC